MFCKRTIFSVSYMQIYILMSQIIVTCKRTIFSVSYMQIHILMSQIIVTMKLDSDSDSDIPTTSSHKQL